MKSGLFKLKTRGKSILKQNKERETKEKKIRKPRSPLVMRKKPTNFAPSVKKEKYGVAPSSGNEIKVCKLRPLCKVGK